MDAYDGEREIYCLPMTHPLTNNLETNCFSDSGAQKKRVRCGAARRGVVCFARAIKDRNVGGFENLRQRSSRFQRPVEKGIPNFRKIKKTDIYEQAARTFSTALLKLSVCIPQNKEGFLLLFDLFVFLIA